MANITLPSPILSLAGIISNANAFVAMLMIGVGFKLSGDKEKIGRIFKILGIRYGVGILFAIIAFFVLPFPKEVRLALMILALAPLPTSSVAYTEDLKGDVGLSSAINSIAIVCSIIFIVVVLLLVL
jgi:predicted permease